MTAPTGTTQDFWRSSGFHHLRRNDHGWLRVTPDWLRIVLARPELAVIEESGPGERALYARLNADPLLRLTESDLAKVEDVDTRENYAHYARFRNRLVDAVTLERFYLQTFRGGKVDFPPVFVDMIARTIVRGMLDGNGTPYTARAGELFFREQRVADEAGKILSADSETIAVFAETGGFGNVGRLMMQQGTPMAAVQMDVLSHENADLYWLSEERYKYVIDLSPESPGTQALARVFEQWLGHFLGLEVSVVSRARIADERWRWHIGLDVEATSILNDLYAGVDVSEDRQSRLICLFEMHIHDQSRVRADARDRPIYLAMAVNDERVLKLKPQNLLVNLPLVESA